MAIRISASFGLLGIAWSLCIALLLSSCNADPADDQALSLEARNLLFIMGDDHSAEVFGAYGNPTIRTPNLDGLAAKGIIFTQAYANSPMCTPTRQSLITGKLPHAVGVTLLPTPLSENEVTIAEHLKQEGFATGAIGKMHFNSTLKHGFDHRVTISDHRESLISNPPGEVPTEVAVRPQWRPFRDPARIWLNADSLPGGLYDKDSEGTFFARKAIDFLRENREQRFCLWLSFREPHSPFNFPIEYQGKYQPSEMKLPPSGPEDQRWIPAIFRNLEETDKKGIVASYYTSVEYLDKNIGLVLDELSALGLDEDTLVIYVGDHGYLLGDHGRFEKHTMWEQAVRAPLIMRMANLTPGERTGLVEFVDLLPTMLDILQVRPMEGIQGQSLLPLLSNQTSQHRKYVFSEYLPDNKAMIRSAEWKYVFSSGKHDLALGYATGFPPPGITHRLYNLLIDPDETKNLSAEPECASVLAELQQEMLQRFKETHPAAQQLPDGLSMEEALAWFCEPPETM